MPNHNTALFVRLFAEEAAAIKEAAKHERRTLSGYILNTVLARIAHDKELEQQWQKHSIRVPDRLP